MAFGMKKIKTVLAILAAVTMLAGSLWRLDSRYAKAEDVQAAQEQITDQITDLRIETIENRISQIQERIWQLEDACSGDFSKMSGHQRDRHRRLTTELENQHNKLERIYDGR